MSGPSSMDSGQASRPRERAPQADGLGPVPRERDADTLNPRSTGVFGEVDFSIVLDDGLRVVRANGNFARWLGHDGPEDLQGRALADTLEQASRSKLEALPRRLAAAPEGPLVVELGHRSVDGRHLLGRYHVFGPGMLGAPQTEMVLLGSDRQMTMALLEEMIGLKREREARLARSREMNQRLARQNADLAALGNLVNNDLTASLNSISLIASLLADRDDLDREAVRRAGGDIQGFCTQMSNLLRGFVAMASVAHEPLRPERVDLTALIGPLARRVAARHEGIPHHVDLQIDAGVAWADPGHLRQIVDHLITNAFLHRDPARPTLEIRVATRNALGGVVLEVGDNGPGIPEDRHDAISRLFTRAHHHLDVADGIGLAIVKRLAEANCGTVSVESRAGRGSTFRVVLPAEPQAFEPA